MKRFQHILIFRKSYKKNFDSTLNLLKYDKQSLPQVAPMFQAFIQIFLYRQNTLYYYVLKIINPFIHTQKEPDTILFLFMSIKQ